MKKHIVTFVYAMSICLLMQAYQRYEPLGHVALHTHHAETHAQPSFWITTVDQFKQLVMEPTALPSVVCVVHSQGASTTDMAGVMKEAHTMLGGKVATYCVDAANEEMNVFVVQLKNKLGLSALPIPAFIFFKQREIVLPVQAGIITAPALATMTKIRFGLNAPAAAQQIARRSTNQAPDKKQMSKSVVMPAA
jgi:hypothetical protein